MGINLYARFRREKPNQELDDWRGLSAVHNKYKIIKKQKSEV